jgi:hypothetical protein
LKILNKALSLLNGKNEGYECQRRDLFIFKCYGLML